MQNVISLGMKHIPVLSCIICLNYVMSSGVTIYRIWKCKKNSDAAHIKDYGVCLVLTLINLLVYGIHTVRAFSIELTLRSATWQKHEGFLFVIAFMVWILISGYRKDIDHAIERQTQQD